MWQPRGNLRAHAFRLHDHIGWAVYGERCCIYLFGEWSVKFFRILFCLVAAAGSVMTLNTVWLISDTANASWPSRTSSASCF